MRNVSKLSNGITVITEKADQFKTASFGIYVNIGSAYENAANKGISHLIEHMIFKGTKTRTAKDIANEMVKLGDDVNAYTTKEYTVFYGTTLSEMLPALIDLLADMVTNSRFDAKDLEREKKIVDEEIALYDDSPEDLVQEKLQEAVWKDHPLGYIISGSAGIVDGITREEIFAFYKEYYSGNNIILSLAGSFPDNITDLLEANFKHIPMGCNKIDRLTVPEYVKTNVFIKKKIDQLHFNIAFPGITADSDEQYVQAVLQSGFGGSNNSLLFQKIREELGLAYSVYSFSNSFTRAGLFEIDVTVNDATFKRTFSEIFKLIDYVKNTGFTEEQTEAFKNQVIIEFIMGNESASDKMSFNARQFMVHGRLIDNNEQINKLKAITPEDIRAFAKKYLVIENTSFSLVGKFGRNTVNAVNNMA